MNPTFFNQLLYASSQHSVFYSQVNQHTKCHITYKPPYNQPMVQALCCFSFGMICKLAAMDGCGNSYICIMHVRYLTGRKGNMEEYNSFWRVAHCIMGHHNEALAG